VHEYIHHANDLEYGDGKTNRDVDHISMDEADIRKVHQLGGSYSQQRHDAKREKHPHVGRDNVTVIVTHCRAPDFGREIFV
jgi:hypothetical protein